MNKPALLKLRKERPPGMPSIEEMNKAIGLRLEMAQNLALPGMNAADALRAINSVLQVSAEIPYPTYAAWLNGNRSLGCREADMLGYMFDVDPGWILFGEGEMRRYPRSRLTGNERFVTF